MNKNKLKFISITAALVLATTFTFSCSGDDGGGDSGGKTPLSTPANVRVDDAGKTAFTLKWDAVTGADSYTLDIDGELKQVSGSTTSYDLKALTADPKVYPIKVRAVADNGDEAHSNSAYSAPLDVEPAKYVFTYEDGIQTQSRLALKPTNLVAAGGGGTITGLTNYGKGLEKIVIPPKIGSVTVTTIGDDAFKDNPIMTAISLPETIITIGAGALSGTNIASLVIPESVLNIGDGAFSNIIVLVVVVFVSPEPPALGDGVFDGSKAIETIVVPDGSGSTYTEKIEEKAPDLAEQVAIEEAKEEKLLIGIEVAQPPKTAYTAGEQFSSAGMTVITRYSDNTTSSVTNYTVLLQTSNGGFSAQSRALTVNDTTVRLSYTEGTVTRTANIAIRVTGPTPTSYPITVNAGNGGTITTNPSRNAAAGDTVYITVTPDQGYTMSPSDLIVMSNGSYINVQPVAGYTDSYTFTMPASAVTVSGTFEPTAYKITANAVGGTDGVSGGTVSTNPQGNATAGTTVTVTVSPNINQGWQLASLSVASNGQSINTQPVSGSTGGYTFTMPASDVTVTGTFEQPPQPTSYPITVNAGNGGLIGTNPYGSAVEGTTVTINVSPNSGYTLASLSVADANGNAVNYNANNRTFTMPASAVTVSGTFEQSTQPTGYSVVTNKPNGGTIYADPFSNAQAGTTVTITVTPDQGYTLASLNIADANNNRINYQTSQTSTGGVVYTFTMPASNVTVTGTFETSGSGTGQ